MTAKASHLALTLMTALMALTPATAKAGTFACSGLDVETYRRISFELRFEPMSPPAYTGGRELPTPGRTGGAFSIIRTANRNPWPLGKVVAQLGSGFLTISFERFKGGHPDYPEGDAIAYDGRTADVFQISCQLR